MAPEPLYRITKPGKAGKAGRVFAGALGRDTLLANFTPAHPWLVRSMSLAFDVDRFDYVSGAWLFWSENHSGQGSEGYARLSRYQFNPGACFTGWQSLSEAARDVYRAWCVRESVDCEYDQLRYLLEQDGWDVDGSDGCVDELLERYGDESPDESGLCNFDRSDWVNEAMPYTSDLLRFYDNNESDVLAWCDRACEAFGFTQRAQLWESETIEDPDDLKASLVNHAMTWCAREALRVAEDQ